MRAHTRTARPSVLAPLAALLLAATTLLPTSAAASAEPDSARGWAPAGRATIHPGVQMFTKGAQCTGNFVFEDGAGRVYVGYAAHCAGKGAATDTDGCSTPSHPLGTRVRFARGATVATAGTTVGHGRLVYSSWTAMQRTAEHRNSACAANDFALVRVDREDRSKVNPSVPFWGGPVGLSSKGPALGEQVYSWGQSSLRPTDLLSPKTGVSMGRTYRGWGWDVYTATPGVPGDSGSGFLDAEGRAFGTLSTVAIAPVPGSNGLGDLAQELSYARSHSSLDGLRLVPGTKKFSPLLP